MRAIFEAIFFAAAYSAITPLSLFGFQATGDVRRFSGLHDAHTASRHEVGIERGAIMGDAFIARESFAAAARVHTLIFYRRLCAGRARQGHTGRDD